MKKLLALGLVTVFAVASAQAAGLQHRYSFDADVAQHGTGTVIDTASGANGDGVGTIGSSGGELILTGVDGFVELPAADIAINTYTDLTLEMWATCADAGADWQTLFMFGQTGGVLDDYLILQGNRLDTVSRVELATDDSTPWSLADGVSGPEVLDQEVCYQIVISGDNLKFWQDGVYQGEATLGTLDPNNSLANVSIANARIGRGYENDGYSTGSVNEYRIWDVAFDETSISNSYARGPDNPPGLAFPFYYANQSPTGGQIINPVSLSVDVFNLDDEFVSADLYLVENGGSTNTIAIDSITPGATNSVIATSATNLAPNTAYTAFVVATGTNSLGTNSWTFTMGKQFDVTRSPTIAATDYDFMPTVSAEIVEVNDGLALASLYVDGVLRDSQIGAGTTTTVSYTIGTPLDPGTVVSNMVITFSDQAYPSATNQWAFTMGGETGKVTFWNPELPAITALDIAYTNSATSDNTNVGADTGEADEGHNWTYVAGDRAPVGQTFTTPAGLAFVVDSVWLRNTIYDDGGNGVDVGDTFRVRITNPALTNSPNFVKGSEVLTAVNTLSDPEIGKWVQFHLSEPVLLNAETVYGFDVDPVSGGPYFNTSGVDAGTYPDGTAYRSDFGGVGLNDAEFNATGDRAFMVQLAEAGDAFNIESVSPVGGGQANPVELEVQVTELAGTVSASSVISLDGTNLSTSVSGSAPNILVSASVPDLLAPSTTHTAQYVIVANEGGAFEPITNDWIFTMAEGFTFANESPTGTIGTNDTAISVEVTDGASFFSFASVLLDDAIVPHNTDTVGSTTTISVDSTGELDYGEHTVDVVVTGTFGTETNSWIFRVKEATTDNVWNINIAGGGQFVTQGTIAVAPASGLNRWNNVTGPGAQPTGHTNSVEVTDSNLENPIRFIIDGIGYYGSATDDGFTVEMSRGWFGGTDGGNPPNADFQVTFTGLTENASYDLYIYDTWRWAGNGLQTFEITEGYVWNNPAIQTSSNIRANIQNDDPQDYSDHVDGENYALFTQVTPVDGRITFTAGNDADRVITGVQLREHPGDGYVPPVLVASVSPEGAVLDDETTLEAVIVDFSESVDTNNLVMLLDGGQVTPDSISKVGTTTTVSYATGILPSGEHTAGFIAVPGFRTNEWTFSLIYESVSPISLKHHWDFEQGSGTTVTDIEGGADGTIIGTNHAWIAGGLDLFGGGSSPDWNSGTNLAPGSYVDLPDGIISSLSSNITIEILYVSEAEGANWQRIYDLGSSTGGTNISGTGSSYLFMTSFIGSGSRVSMQPEGSGEIFQVNSPDQNVGNLTHAVFVYDPAESIAKLYQNGLLVDQEYVANNQPLSSIDDFNNWLGRAQWGDDMFDGKYYDLRIYEGVMTADEVYETYRLIQDEPVILVSSSPTGQILEDTPLLEAVLKDGTEIIVNTNDVVLLLDGSSVGAIDSVVKEGYDLTISHQLVSALPAGEYTVGVIPILGGATNEWQFEVVDPDVTGGIYIWTNAPVAGAEDIAQLTFGTSQSNNVVPGDPDDEYTYVAGDRPAQGQTFLTGSSNSYELTQIWVKQAVNNTYSGVGAGSAVKVRITQPLEEGTENFVLYEDTLTVSPLGDSSTLSTDDATNSPYWLQFTLGTKLLVSGGTQLGFDLSSGTYFELAGTSNATAYAEGNAYGSQPFVTDGDGNLVAEIYEGDRTFLLRLAGSDQIPGPLQPPTVSLSVPAGGPIVLEWGDGFPYTIWTNSDLLNSAGWGILIEGAESPFTNSIGGEESLFLQLEY